MSRRQPPQTETGRRAKERAETAYRDLPRDDAAERATLAAVFFSNEAFDEVADVLKVDDYARETHKLIFAAMAELRARNEPIDVVTLCDELRKDGRLAKIGDWTKVSSDLTEHTGETFIFALASESYTSVRARYHATIVRRKRVMRDLIRLCGSVADRAYAVAEDEQDLLLDASRELGALLDEGLKSRPAVQVAIAAGEVWEQIQAEAGGQAPSQSMSIGIGGLDAIPGLFGRGRLVIIAARPGGGKTTLAQQAAVYICENFETVFDLHGVEHRLPRYGLFCSQEMSRSEIAYRLLASKARVAHPRLMDPQRLNEHQLAALHRTVDQLISTYLWVCDKPYLTVGDVEREMLRVRRQAGRLDTVVVDYLGLMDAEAVKGETLDQSLGRLLKRLKGMAREHNVCLIVPVQMNRQGEGAKPLMSHMRDTGNIEADADTVIALQRTGKREVVGDHGGKLTLTDLTAHILKNRNGPSGDEVPLEMAGAFFSVADYDAHRNSLSPHYGMFGDRADDEAMPFAEQAPPHPGPAKSAITREVESWDELRNQPPAPGGLKNLTGGPRRG